MPGAIVLSNRVASSGMSLWELLRMLLGESKQARIIAAIIAAWAANKLRKLLVGNGIPRADFPKQTPRGMLRPYGWGYRDSGFQVRGFGETCGRSLRPSQPRRHVALTLTPLLLLCRRR